MDNLVDDKSYHFHEPGGVRKLSGCPLRVCEIMKKVVYFYREYDTLVLPSGNRPVDLPVRGIELWTTGEVSSEWTTGFVKMIII